MLADKVYSVSLGNGYNGKFPSRKIALAFLAETNRDLNTKMYELNFLFSELLRTYRASWIYFEKNANIESICAEYILRIETSFNLLVNRAGYENGNYFVFSHFHSIIDCINDVCNTLQVVYVKRGLTGLIYETNSYITRANYIKTYIVIYPRKLEHVQDKYQHKTFLKVAQ